MAPPPASASSGLGASIRQARRARVRMMRRRIVAGTLALFMAVWLLIAVTLVTGHDPALAKRSATSVSAAGSGAASGSSSASVSPSSLTTRQS